MVGPDDPEGLLQPKLFYDSVILIVLIDAQFMKLFFYFKQSYLPLKIAEYFQLFKTFCCVVGFC